MSHYLVSKWTVDRRYQGVMCNAWRQQHRNVSVYFCFDRKLITELSKSWSNKHTFVYYNHWWILTDKLPLCPYQVRHSRTSGGGVFPLFFCTPYKCSQRRQSSSLLRPFPSLVSRCTYLKRIWEPIFVCASKEWQVLFFAPTPHPFFKLWKDVVPL